MRTPELDSSHRSSEANSPISKIRLERQRQNCYSIFAQTTARNPCPPPRHWLSNDITHLNALEAIYKSILNRKNMQLTRRQMLNQRALTSLLEHVEISTTSVEHQMALVSSQHLASLSKGNLKNILGIPSPQQQSGEFVWHIAELDDHTNLFSALRVSERSKLHLVRDAQTA
jgi:hypothetical protein